MISSTSAKLELDSVAPSLTGAGFAAGGGVVIGAQKQPTVHRAKANNTAVEVLSIFISLSWQYLVVFADFFLR